MDPIVKKILIGIAIIALVLILVFVIGKVTKKNDTKKEETKVEEKKQDEQEVENPDINDPDEVPLPQDNIVKTIKCTYEGEEHNVVWEKSYVVFSLDEFNKVVIREDVREYKFEKVDIDDYINNKTLTVISGVLDGIKGISSTLTTIDQAEHTYRFSTVFNFKEINQDDLYNFYYKRFYNNGDIKMTREQFDERYKSLDYDAMAKAYINTGYTCN